MIFILTKSIKDFILTGFTPNNDEDLKKLYVPVDYNTLPLLKQNQIWSYVWKFLEIESKTNETVHGFISTIPPTMILGGPLMRCLIYILIGAPKIPEPYAKIDPTYALYNTSTMYEKENMIIEFANIIYNNWTNGPQFLQLLTKLHPPAATLNKVLENQGQLVDYNTDQGYYDI